MKNSQPACTMASRDTAAASAIDLHLPGASHQEVAEFVHDATNPVDAAHAHGGTSASDEAQACAPRAVASALPSSKRPASGDANDDNNDDNDNDGVDVDDSGAAAGPGAGLEYTTRDNLFTSEIFKIVIRNLGASRDRDV